MDLDCFSLLFCYENKKIRRSIILKIFFTVSIVFAVLYSLFFHTTTIIPIMETWDRIALSSFIPFSINIQYNVIQCITIIFSSNIFPSKRIDSFDVLKIKPFTNFTYIFSKAINIISTFAIINLLVNTIVLFIHICFINGPINIGYYLLAIAYISLPASIFIVGLSFFIQSLFGSSSISNILTCIAIIIFYEFSSIGYGSLDLFCLNIPTVFSDLIGMVNFTTFIYQRLFFLFCGIGLLFLTTININRICYIKKNKHLILFTGLIIIVLANVCLFRFANTFYKTQETRVVYTQTYRKYFSEYNVDVIDYDISIKFSHQTINAQSILSLTNSHSINITRPILFLNPSLKIESISCNHIPVEFSREHQVVILNKPIIPHDTIKLEIIYSGFIDERICYVDIEDKKFYEYYSNFLNNSEKIYHYISDEYVILTPECLWYPVSLTGINLSSRWNSKRTFSNFKLKVEHSQNLKAISQGQKHITNNITQFCTEYPIPFLSLAIGDYKEKKIYIDSTSIEMYYFRGNGAWMDSFNTLENSLHDIIKELKVNQEFLRNKSYPFKRFMLVEIPFQFYSYSRTWRNYTDFIMPEILFYPENGTKLGVDINALKQTTIYKYLNQQGRQSDSTINSEVFKAFVNNVLSKDINTGWMGMSSTERNVFNIGPLFYDYTNCIISEEYPVIDAIFNKTFQNWYIIGRGSRYDRLTNNQIGDTQQALDYLNRNSFKHALSDSSMSTTLFDEIIKLKSREIKNYLRSQVENDKFSNLIKDFNTKFNRGCITLSELNTLLFNQYNIDFASFVEKWYNTQSLPKFKISGVALTQIEDSQDSKTKYQISFIISNDSNTDGVIYCNTIGYAKYFHIPGNSSFEINLLANSKPNYLYINTNLSENYPNEYSYNLILSKKIIGKTKEDIIPFNAKEELNSDFKERIIDNEDSTNFFMFNGKKANIISSLKEVKTNQYKQIDYIIPPPIWTKFAHHNCYGDYKRSGYYKKQGDGNKFVEWSTKIEDDGTYNVYIWNPTMPEIKNKGIQNYYIFSNEKKISFCDIDLSTATQGWVLLGNYYLEKGEMKLRLTDKGSGKIVIADAVRIMKDINK